jgi:hypothetical protein
MLRSHLLLSLLVPALAVALAPTRLMAQMPTAQAHPEAMPAMEMHHPPTGPVGPLVVSLAGKQESWTAATLAPMPHVTIALYNAHTKTTQNFTGVPLITLLARLGFPTTPHGKDLSYYLIAAGADGYQVVYSGGEVTPDLHEGTVLVADAVDGKPLADTGPLQLVTTGDKRPARWVRNLVSVQVKGIE